MSYPIKVHGSISFATDTARRETSGLVKVATAEHARVGETLFRKELGDSSLSTLEASLGLSVTRPCLLAFVSASRGLSQSRATTTTNALLLWGLCGCENRVTEPI